MGLEIMHFVGTGLAFHDSWTDVLRLLKNDLEHISPNIKIREFKNLDFVVPRDKEKEFLSIALNFEGSRLREKSAMLQNNIIMRKLLQKCEIEPIDKNVPLVNCRCVEECKKKGNIWLYLHLLGKVKDHIREDGVELY
jgi:hypothetical protein